MKTISQLSKLPILCTARSPYFKHVHLRLEKPGFHSITLPIDIFDPI